MIYKYCQSYHSHQNVEGCGFKPHVGTQIFNFVTAWFLCNLPRNELHPDLIPVRIYKCGETNETRSHHTNVQFDSSHVFTVVELFWRNGSITCQRWRLANFFFEEFFSRAQSGLQRSYLNLISCVSNSGLWENTFNACCQCLRPLHCCMHTNHVAVLYTTTPRF